MLELLLVHLQNHVKPVIHARLGFIARARNLARPHREEQGSILEVVSAAVISTRSGIDARSRTLTSKRLPRKSHRRVVRARRRDTRAAAARLHLPVLTHGRRRAHAIAWTCAPRSKPHTAWRFARGDFAQLLGARRAAQQLPVAKPGAAAPQVLPNQAPRELPEVSMVPANARQPVDYAAGGRTHAASSSLRRWRRGTSVSAHAGNVASAAGFQKQTDATGREYLVDKLTGAWTPVAELTNNAPVSPLRDGEDAAMYQRPSACHPSATTSVIKNAAATRWGRSGRANPPTTTRPSSRRKTSATEVPARRGRAVAGAPRRRGAPHGRGPARDGDRDLVAQGQPRPDAPQSLESLARGVTP